MARRPSPENDWAPIDELLWRWRRNLSSGQSAIARALGDRTIWDSTWPDQLTRAFESRENNLRPQPMISLRPADVVALADTQAKARGSALIGEQDLVMALLANHRSHLEAMGIRVDRLLEAVKAAEDDPIASSIPRVGVAGGTDVFISHAGEDSGVAGPLADELTNRGYKVWYDRYVLRVGDSLRRQIDEGLAQCRYGIVILSHSFFAKPWPQTELDGLAARENSGGGKVILPVWHGLDHADVLGYSVTLADKVGIPTSRGMSAVADEIVRVLRDEERIPTPGAVRPLLHSFAAPDAKRDRLQPAYAALLRAAKATEQAADEFSYLRDGETKEQRSARWDAVLRPLKLAADQAIIDLELETGTDDVIRAFVGAWNEFIVYRMDFSNNEVHHGSVPVSEFTRHRQELRASVTAVAETARRHLAEFDQRDRPPVRVEVQPGYVAEDATGKTREMLMVTISNDSDRPQRVDTVAVVLSGQGGDLVVADPAPFLPTPQMVTETQSYTTGFDLEALKSATHKQRDAHGDPEIRPVGVRVRLASGRTVEADTRHIDNLAF